MNKYEYNHLGKIMFRKKLLLTLFLFMSTLYAENQIAINLNSEDVELQGAYGLNSALGYDGGIVLSVDTSYLFNENNNLFTLGINGKNSLEAAPGLIFGFGFEAAFAKDFMAIPLMGQVRYILPFDSDIPTTSLFARYAYAPSMLTFVDGETYSSLRLEADMEVISNIHLYTGYRNIETDYINVDYTLNDSFYAGLKFDF